MKSLDSVGPYTGAAPTSRSPELNPIEILGDVSVHQVGPDRLLSHEGHAPMLAGTREVRVCTRRNPGPLHQCRL